MKIILFALIVFVSVGKLHAYETMFFRCDGQTIDIIGDRNSPESFDEVEVLEINVEDDVVRWDGKEVELYDGFFEDGEITFFDEYTNIRLALDKRTGILEVDRIYYSSKQFFTFTYQCTKMSSKSLW